MPFRPITRKNEPLSQGAQHSKMLAGEASEVNGRARIRRQAPSSSSGISGSGEDNNIPTARLEQDQCAAALRDADRVALNNYDSRSPKGRRTNWNEDGSYKIGKGKPSPDHYFPKGKSGNPKGRPKGKRSINTQAKAIFDVKVPVKVNGETRMLDATGVMLTKLYELAAKGKLAAIAQVLAIQRERYPEAVSPAAPNPLSSDELSLIDAILTEAGFAATPVSRAGRGKSTTLEDEI
jgi:Family of unknown function (DUF5681)